MSTETFLFGLCITEFNPGIAFYSILFQPSLFFSVPIYLIERCTKDPAYTSMSNDISTSIDPLNIVSNPAHPGAKQTAKKRKLQAKKYMNDEAKRKNFLERNRQGTCDEV
jgi:hypothetical protein